MKQWSNTDTEDILMTVFMTAMTTIARTCISVMKEKKLVLGNEYEPWEEK